MANAADITGLEGTVTALAFSPDGKTLAAADGGFDLSLWDVASGKSLFKLTGLATGSNRVCWAPNGKTVYGNTGNDWIAWDASSGREKQKIKAAMTGTAPSGIALSADGKTIVAAGRGLIKLWETASGTPLGEYEAHPNYAINSVAFSPDGKFVVTTSNDRTAQLTEAANGSAGTTFTCENRVVAAEFSPDSKTLFVVDQGPLLHVIEVESGQDNPAPGLSRVPKQIAVSPDGQLVACAGATLQIWSLPDKSWHETPLKDTAVGATAVAFSPDGKTLACGDADGKIHLWPTKDLLN